MPEIREALSSMFIEKLHNAWKKNNSLVCVGLDPDIERFPPDIERSAEGIFEFNRAIIDATHDLVCAYKPQIAYFAALSAEDVLEQTIAYIKENYPAIPVILDAKRGDIGSTAEQYAKEAFLRYDADAVTVNPFLGQDSVQPFLEYRDRGVIILCRTSNRGASDLQDLNIDGEPLFKRLATMIANEWNHYNNCALVVGATWPEQLAEIRKIVGDMPILVPGIGTQGGDVEKVITAGKTSDGTGLIVNSSREIIYASSDDDFADAAREVAMALRDEINKYR